MILIIDCLVLNNVIVLKDVGGLNVIFNYSGHWLEDIRYLSQKVLLVFAIYARMLGLDTWWVLMYSWYKGKRKILFIHNVHQWQLVWDQHSYQSMAEVLGNLIKHAFDSFKSMPLMHVLIKFEGIDKTASKLALEGSKP